MPTLLDLCDIASPESVDGKSYKNYLDEKEQMEDESVLLQCLHPFGQ